MLDPKFIRDNAELVKQKLTARGVKLDLEQFLTLEKQRREMLQEIEKLRAERNQASDSIARMKKKRKTFLPGYSQRLKKRRRESRCWKMISNQSRRLSATACLWFPIFPMHLSPPVTAAMITRRHGAGERRRNFLSSRSPTGNWERSCRFLILTGEQKLPAPVLRSIGVRERFWRLRKSGESRAMVRTAFVAARCISKTKLPPGRKSQACRKTE